MRGVEGAIKALKDHKNPLMHTEEWLRDPFRCSLARELESTGGAKMLCSQDLDECGTESVVRLTVVNPQFLSNPFQEQSINSSELACGLTNLALVMLVGAWSHRLHLRNQEP